MFEWEATIDMSVDNINMVGGGERPFHCQFITQNIDNIANGRYCVYVNIYLSTFKENSNSQYHNLQLDR